MELFILKTYKGSRKITYTQSLHEQWKKPQKLRPCVKTANTGASAPKCVGGANLGGHQN